MDEPIIELTPEWIEFQNLLNEAKAIGASIPSSGKITIKILKNAITDKIYMDNNNSLSR